MIPKSYTLSRRAPFNPGWRKTYYEDVAQAPLAAWRKRQKDWLVDGIAKGQQTVLNDEGLAQALYRMEEILGESPKASPYEAAMQALREMAVAGQRRRREA